MVSLMIFDLTCDLEGVKFLYFKLTSSSLLACNYELLFNVCRCRSFYIGE